MKKQLKYIVFYCEFPYMRERVFADKVEAETFAALHNSTPCEIYL